MKTSIIIPVYNEEKTIKKILDKVLASPIKKEVIVVNDGSTDKTLKILGKYKKEITYVSHRKNLGKGRAIRTGLKYVSGEIVLIQDADLEYDPSDYQDLVKPIIEKKAKVVYGSRWLGKRKKKPPSGRLHTPAFLFRLWRNFVPIPSGLEAVVVKPSVFYFGTQFLTWVTNLLYGTKITDESCGYKVFDTKLFKSLSLKSKGFEFCPEVTAKIAKKSVQIIEVPIQYTPRSIGEGKKIKWRDGIVALFTLIKYRFEWSKIVLPFFLLWTVFILALYIIELLCRGGICLNWRSP